MKKQGILISIVVLIAVFIIILFLVQGRKEFSLNSEDRAENISKTTAKKEDEKKPSEPPGNAVIKKNLSKSPKSSEITDIRKESLQMRKSLKGAMEAVKKTEKGKKVSSKLESFQEKAAELLPEKLLLPEDEIKYAKNNGQLNDYDRKVLDFINLVRAANNLEMLKKMPTGLNEKECLALMNAMRVMRGDKPLDNMPTGLKLK
jgi:hypothetical protein